jgi:hypothetical protein
MEVISMGKTIKEQVGEAFAIYKAGDFKGFVSALMSFSGKGYYSWQRQLLMEAVEDELAKL